MRIISGKAKGTNLYTLKGNQTRPTTDRAKEALFNIIGPNIVECTFLDLFAGSGAIGLEAASRGAKKVTLADKSFDAINIVKKNIQKTHLENETTVYKLDCELVLKTKIKEKQDYIFLDPPYKSDLLYKTIQIILKKDLLNENGIIIEEKDRLEEIEEKIKNLEINILDVRRYGRNQFIFLQKVV